VIVVTQFQGASSSAGRAPRSQRGGRRFDPGLVHQRFQRISPLLIFLEQQILCRNCVVAGLPKAFERFMLRRNPRVAVVPEHFVRNVAGNAHDRRIARTAFAYLRDRPVTF
jgi:hypothetical protein